MASFSIIRLLALFSKINMKSPSKRLPEFLLSLVFTVYPYTEAVVKKESYEPRIVLGARMIPTWRGTDVKV